MSKGDVIVIDGEAWFRDDKFGMEEIRMIIFFFCYQSKTLCIIKRTKKKKKMDIHPAYFHALMEQTGGSNYPIHKHKRRSKKFSKGHKRGHKDYGYHHIE